MHVINCSNTLASSRRRERGLRSSQPESVCSATLGESHQPGEQHAIRTASSPIRNTAAVLMVELKIVLAEKSGWSAVLRRCGDRAMSSLVS